MKSCTKLYGITLNNNNISVIDIFINYISLCITYFDNIFRYVFL